MRNKIRNFKDQLKQLQKKYKIPGLSFIILHENKILDTEGLGYADIDNKIEAKSKTQYRIASLTKPISATIILKLMELGILSLDDCISDLYPEYEEKFQEVTEVLKMQHFKCKIFEKFLNKLDKLIRKISIN